MASSWSWNYSPTVQLDGQGTRTRLHLFERCEGWTILELASNDNLPFTAHLAIGLAQGFRSEVALDVSGWARVCIATRTLLVEATNLHGTAHQVRATVAQVEQPVPTQNYFHTHVVGQGAGNWVQVTIPAAAKAVTFESDSQDPAVLPLIQVELRDKNNVTFATHTFATLSASTPLVLSEATSLWVQTESAHLLRALWHLIF